MKLSTETDKFDDANKRLAGTGCSDILMACESLRLWG